MSVTSQAADAYVIYDRLSWSLLVISSVQGGVALGIVLCDCVSLVPDLVASLLLVFVAFAAVSVYLDHRARAILRDATGFSSLRSYLAAEGGDA